MRALLNRFKCPIRTVTIIPDPRIDLPSAKFQPHRSCLRTGGGSVCGRA
jgi:hypothetical protein